MTNKYLNEKFDILAEELFDENKNFDLEVVKNLNQSFPLREYQLAGLNRAKYYFERYKNKKSTNVHLMFNMATGSGKTMMMGSLILYLHNRGYRNFVFFVNSKTILEKTKDNFADKASKKYLFNKDISINNKKVKIKTVENFDEASDANINIKFTTINKLHSDICSIKENNVNIESLKEKKLVLLADEAHHFSQKKDTDDPNWENTVDRLLQNNKDNILLEFTATVPLGEEKIKNKYTDKLIYKYDLKKFREDGYSKEIKNIEIDVEKYDYLMLQAIILSQYRLKLAQKRLKLNIKPVILFKAQKTIKQNGENLEHFRKLIDGLAPENINKFKKQVLSNSRTNLFKKVFDFFEKEKITSEILVEELKEDFSKEKIISTNSDQEKEEQQKILNSLEGKDNLIRAIFTVDKLNEGWDVLNLYDIVRLYNTRDSKSNIPGKTTIKEVQLIGRGARYYPFKLPEEFEEKKFINDKFKRKFDHDKENELKILEDFYYHSIYNSRYIAELNAELEKQGLTDSSRIQRTIKLKSSFVQSDTYKSGHVFVNYPKKIEENDIKSFDNLNFEKVLLFSAGVREGVLMDREKNKKEEMRKVKTFNLVEDIPIVYIKKAIARNNFFKLDNLLNKGFGLSSVDGDFIKGKKYLSKITFNVERFEEDISPDDYLCICDNILKQLENKIRDELPEKIGNNIFYPKAINTVFSKEKEISFQIGDEKAIAQSKSSNDDLVFDTSKANWYAYDENYGTSEEKKFVRYIEQYIIRLKNELKDAEIFLLRNELFFYLFGFKTGEPFSPDYILIINDIKKDKTYYQLICEPKGGHIAAKDKWKNDFLLEIESKFRTHSKPNNSFIPKNLNIIGLPFYNSDDFKDFDKKIKEVIDAISTPQTKNAKTETRKFIPITDVFDKELFEKGIPVLAEVNAGEPLNIAEENLIGYIVDGENKKIKKDDLFAVRVDGHSMNKKEINGKKITKGSYAVVKNTQDAENGDIILAIVNGNATIKQYYKKQNTITLRSISTQNTPDITITNPDPPDFLINGKIVGVI